MSQVSRQSDDSSGPPGLWGRLWICIRSTWSMALASAMLLTWFPERFDENIGLKLLCRLDVGRRVFWFLSAIAAIGLLAPIPRLRGSRRAGIGVQIIIAAAAALWLLLMAAALRDGIVSNAGYKLARLYAAINLFSLIAAGLFESGPIIRLARVPVLGELLLPLGFWAARQREGRPKGLPRLGRVVPMAALCLACGLFSIKGILDAPWRPEVWKFRAHIVWDKQKHGLAVEADPRRQIAMVATIADGILIVSTKDGTLMDDLRLPTNSDLTHMAWDASARLLYALDARGKLFTVRPDSGEVTEKGEFSGSRFEYIDTNSVRATVDPGGRSMWLVDVDGGISRLDLERMEVAARYEAPEGTQSSFLPHMEKGLLYALNRDGTIVELDLFSLSKKRGLKLDDYASQITYDPERDRLFISLTEVGAIAVVDRERMEVVKRIPAIVGCRAIKALPEKRLLLVGGFAPYLEIFDLDSLDLLTRIHVLCWVRSVDADQASGLAIIVDKHIGVTAFDYAGPAQRARSTRLRVDDPFFALSRSIARRFMRR